MIYRVYRKFQCVGYLDIEAESLTGAIVEAEGYAHQPDMWDEVTEEESEQLGVQEMEDGIRRK